jgi:glutamate/tyrosine decarboxylase-like PLP-dependent enzyme
MREFVPKNILNQCTEFVKEWKNQWPEFFSDPSLEVSSAHVSRVFQSLFQRLKKSYPFHYPGYAGQMLKPPHQIAIFAYFAALHINSNNHALDGGPATSEMEIEAVSKLAEMFGFKKYIGHLTGGGTVANMEALWTAREIHPRSSVALGSQAHYTHPRVCKILKLPYFVVRQDLQGRMDLNHLESLLKKHKIGTVVATLGTTALGALDPLDEILKLKERYRFRVHVDAAYGGFFKLLSQGKSPLVEPSPFKNISRCDSIVIDPHKHGLQPYGCGCVIFGDPSVGKIYKHDSPYTYFTSNKLHLGEISFECSRPGAAAAALWTTLNCFPLERSCGMGAVLSRCRSAAIHFTELIQKEGTFYPVVQPELDIVAYFHSRKNQMSRISESTHSIFRKAEKDKKFPVYLSKLQVESEWLKRKFPRLQLDEPQVTVVRSVFMKPEHLNYLGKIYESLLRNAK